MPQEFLANQERLRPQEERNQEDRAKVAPCLAASHPVDACGCCCCSLCATDTQLTFLLLAGRHARGQAAPPRLKPGAVCEAGG